MDRCGVFIDAGYLFAAGGQLCGYEPARGNVDIDGLIASEFFAKLASESCGVPLLRTYSYNGAKDEVPSESPSSQPTPEPAPAPRLDSELTTTRDASVPTVVSAGQYCPVRRTLGGRQMFGIMTGCRCPRPASPPLRRADKAKRSRN